MTLITQGILNTMRHRRAAGERVSVLAGELGIPWQKLDKAIRHGLRQQLAEAPSSEPSLAALPHVAAGSLTDRYRPANLAGLFGQERVVQFLRRFAQAPHPIALLFEGETGTGKTSAALALAAELGCKVEHAEFGGVHVIASGEQSADAVRATCEAMHRTPFYGSGWKVVIVNEADRMNVAAETIWLDRLEALPPRAVIVFTTNHAGRLSQRFRDRCIRVQFQSDAGRLLGSAKALLTAVWRSETDRAPDPRLIASLAVQAVEDGKLSFRRAVQALQKQLMERSPS